MRRRNLTFDLERITDRSALEQLVPSWWALWRSCDATPFQSPAWLLPWWDAFAPGNLLVLAVRRSGTLCALAPFYTDEARIARPLGVSVSDYLDVLIAPTFHEQAAAALNGAIIAELQTSVVQWEMPDLRPEAMAWALAPAADEWLGPETPCPLLQRNPATGTLMGSVPGGKRRKLRMAQHRATRIGTGTVERVNASAIDAAFTSLVRLHRARWAQNGGGVLSDPRTLQFHRAAMPALSRAGLLDLLVFEVEGTTSGVYYGLRDAARAYAYLGGFDAAHAKLSPGSRLLQAAIEDACRAGCAEFHFLRGAEAYKYDWGAIERSNRDRVFRPLSPVPQ